MNREEEKMQAALRYANAVTDGVQDDSYFDIVMKTHLDATKWADRTIIDKACGWMEHHLLDNVGKSWKEVCEIFRKAMEG